MGINQDAIELWNVLLSSDDVNEKYKMRDDFLKAIHFLGEFVTKKDLKNGWLRPYDKLDSSTKCAIKESIFNISDSEYREKLFKMLYDTNQKIRGLKHANNN